MKNTYGSEGEFVGQDSSCRRCPMESVFNARLQTICVRMDGMDNALLIRKAEMDRRLDGLNQLREDVIRDRDMFLRRDTYESKHEALSVWIKSIDTALNEAKSRTNDRLTRVETSIFIWGGVITVITLTIQLIFHFFDKG